MSALCAPAETQVESYEDYPAENKFV